MLTTDQKGAIAETAIVHTAIKAGFGVWRPVAEGERYDLILRVGARLLRVQCKWAPRHGDVVVVRCYSSRRARAGLVRCKYERDEIDAIAAYCEEIDRCYYLPVELCAGRLQFHLRLAPARNNQKSGINWAHDFDLAATLRVQLGAIAQLGERPDGIRKVGGSIPPGSIARLAPRSGAEQIPLNL
jgi:hypothetical protein